MGKRSRGNKTKDARSKTKLQSASPKTTDLQKNSRDTSIVEPEKMSLIAHSQIQTCLQQLKRDEFTKDDLNAVLRLSQHLRVFGLLSAAGYINQKNEQNGKVRQRTVPIWASLIGQLIDEKESLSQKEIRDRITKLAQEQPALYMIQWRRALTLAHHWNFWAAAYKQKETQE